MCFEVSRIDGDRFVGGALCRQSRHDPGEHTHITPPFPPVVESLVTTILTQRVTPAQEITVNGYNTAQDAPVINARNTPALREIGPKPLHLRLTQPIKIAH